MPHVSTLTSKHDAEDLAQSIVNYWGAKGYLVRTSLEKITAPYSPRSDGERVLWVVRSDMVNGKPRGAGYEEVT